MPTKPTTAKIAWRVKRVPGRARGAQVAAPTPPTSPSPGRAGPARSPRRAGRRRSTTGRPAAAWGRAGPTGGGPGRCPARAPAGSGSPPPACGAACGSAVSVGLMRCPSLGRGGGGRGGRSRRPARRRTSTSRRTRSPGTARRRPRAAPTAAARSTASAIEAASCTAATISRRRRPRRRRPRRWPRRRGRRPPSPSRPWRSRPLLRPPAISTTEAKAPTAAAVAWGVVALESSYQRTPPRSPTSCTRWGRPSKVVQRRGATASSATPSGAGRRAAAARALARSWGRRPAQVVDGEQRPVVDDQPAVADGGVLGRRPKPNVAAAGRARWWPATTGSSALATATSSGPWSAQMRALAAS